MSNIEVKLSLSATEFNQIVQLVRTAWDDSAACLKATREGYLEYRSSAAREAGEPETIGEYYVNAAENALPKLRALQGVTHLLGLDAAIDPDRVALLDQIKAELAEQKARLDTEAQVTN